MSKEMRKYIDEFKKFILKESNDNENISIRFGRSLKRNEDTIQNVIVNYKGKDITGQLPKTNLPDEDLGNYGAYGGDIGGELYLILPDNENVAYVGTITIPKELRGQGLGKQIYQAIANKIGKPIKDFSKYAGRGVGYKQSGAGQDFWKNRTSFEPNN